MSDSGADRFTAVHSPLARDTGRIAAPELWCPATFRWDAPEPLNDGRANLR